MKNILLIISVFIILVSCQNQNHQSEESVVQPLPSNVTVLRTTEHKYVFVVVMVEMPTLDKLETIEWKLKRYFSDVIDVSNYDKDKKFRIMDSVQKTFSITNLEFITQVANRINDPERINRLSVIHPKIIDRGVIESNSYHEASEKLSQARMNESQSDGKIEPVNVVLGSEKK